MVESEMQQRTRRKNRVKRITTKDVTRRKRMREFSTTREETEEAEENKTQKENSMLYLCDSPCA
jgi:hypothetical protein